MQTVRLCTDLDRGMASHNLQSAKSYDIDLIKRKSGVQRKPERGQGEMFGYFLHNFQIEQIPDRPTYQE